MAALPLDVDAPTWLGLEGARVLIAGAGGIGGACALAYLRAGASVLVVDRSEDALSALAAEPEFRDGDAHTLRADLAEHGSGAAVVAAAVEALGGLDVLLHAVGINDRRPILDFSEEEWDRILKVNLSSLFGLAQAAGRHMVAHRAGRVLALSSVSGLLDDPGAGAVLGEVGADGGAVEALLAEGGEGLGAAVDHRDGGTGFRVGGGAGPADPPGTRDQDPRSLEPEPGGVRPALRHRIPTASLFENDFRQGRPREQGCQSDWGRRRFASSTAMRSKARAAPSRSSVDRQSTIVAGGMSVIGTNASPSRE